MKGLRVAISEGALLARLNRKLAGEGTRVYKNQATICEPSLGEYFLVNVAGNFIVIADVNLAEYARSAGILKPHEQLAR